MTKWIDTIDKMCLYPKLIKNRKYTATKKNGGIIPAVLDERTLLVPVGCGKCMECMKQKSRTWQVRLNEDIRHNKNGVFVTLTFSNESYTELSKEVHWKIEGYERENEIATIAMRKFNERWRKKYKKALRHWMVTELGHNGTENIHIHGIVWTDIDSKEIERIWKYGYVWIGDAKKGTGWVNEQTVSYISKYVNKIDLQHKEYKPKMLTSAGIGKGYLNRTDSRLNKYTTKKTDESYTNRQGFKMALPIYYRNKIYTEEEREKLWIEKIDKNERWINGMKIDISEGEEEYYKVLEEERRKNKRLGYGDNEINWERRMYENQRRNELYKERTKVLTTATAGQASEQAQNGGTTPF